MRHFWSLLLWIAWADNTWHLVDVSQVMCPKPTSSDPTAPELPDYKVGIEYTSSIDETSPHIVSFIRATSEAMTVKFRIEDANGEQVVPETMVALRAVSNTVPSTCGCTNPSVPASVSSVYGAGYGSSCQAWDDANCGDLWGEVSLGAWCCRPWCYASSDCPDAYQSQAMPGQYFSYAACESVDPVTPCTWTQEAKKHDPCTCKNRASLFNAAMNSKFPSDYGSSCGAWDMVNCALNYPPDQVDLWCCADWCYVDKECPHAIASLNDGMEGVLYWSDNACQDDASRMLQCPYKPTPNNTNESCQCLGESLPESYLSEKGINMSLHVGFGAQCGPHDAFLCEVMYPNADHGMWCCRSWCYVSETCPTARASTIWPGHFWSEENCTLDPEIVSSCQYDSLACECRGKLPAGVLGSSFSENYGSSCGAWDMVDCAATWSQDPNSSWSTSSDHEWCCDSWCYVNASCPIAKKSWLGNGYYWSYETCDATGPKTSRRQQGYNSPSTGWSTPSTWFSLQQLLPSPTLQ